MEVNIISATDGAGIWNRITAVTDSDGTARPGLNGWGELEPGSGDGQHRGWQSHPCTGQGAPTFDTPISSLARGVGVPNEVRCLRVATPIAAAVPSMPITFIVYSRDPRAMTALPQTPAPISLPSKPVSPFRRASKLRTFVLPFISNPGIQFQQQLHFGPPQALGLQALPPSIGCP
jgi:hypothetical protein